MRGFHVARLDIVQLDSNSRNNTRLGPLAAASKRAACRGDVGRCRGGLPVKQQQQIDGLLRVERRRLLPHSHPRPFARRRWQQCKRRWQEYKRLRQQRKRRRQPLALPPRARSEAPWRRSARRRSLPAPLQPGRLGRPRVADAQLLVAGAARRPRAARGRAAPATAVRDAGGQRAASLRALRAPFEVAAPSAAVLLAAQRAGIAPAAVRRAYGVHRTVSAAGDGATVATAVHLAARRRRRALRRAQAAWVLAAPPATVPFAARLRHLARLASGDGAQHGNLPRPAR